MSDAPSKPAVPSEFAQARERFLELVAEVRPELHRYCARLTGSVIDGEDIVQEALARAFYAISLTTELPPLRPWLFRIAHNAALDHLKRYERRHVEPRAEFDDGDVAGVAIAGVEAPADPAVVRAALASFLALPVAQRSAVILKDVLGQSVDEAAETMGTTVPAVKAALVRGRAALRALAADAPDSATTPAPTATPPDPAERERLALYAALFNARNWEGLRALMAEECRLDLVAKNARRGAAVQGYFARYASEPEARLAPGEVDGRPALLYSPRAGAAPTYFILLEWAGDRVATIRDFRYVPYIAREAHLVPTAGS